MPPAERWNAFRQDIRDTLNPSNIRAVWHRLGADLPDRHADGFLDGYGPAALGEGGKNPSFGVNLEHGGYRDLGGAGVSGDIFRGVEECLGLSSAEAAVWLAEALGVTVPDGLSSGRGAPSGTAGVRIKRPAERERVEIGPERPGLPDGDGRRVTARALAEARGALDSMTADALALRAYLDRRSIGPDARARYQLGLIYSAGRPWLYVPARWESNDDPATGGAVVTHAQRWAFDATGGADGRGGWATDSNGKKLVRTDGGTVLFPSPADPDGPTTDRPGVVLCEGPWDTISAREAGFDAFGTLGVSAVSDDDLARLAKRPHARRGGLCLAFDADGGGRAGTERVLNILRDRPDILDGFGGRVTDAAKMFDEGEDVNARAVRVGLGCLAVDIGLAPEAHVEGASVDTADESKMLSASLRDSGWQKAFSLFRTASELSRNPAPPTEWIVPTLIPAGAVVMLSGPPKGGGKTTLLTHAIEAVVRGGLFLGQKCARSPVVYLSEQSRSQFEAEYLAPVGLLESDDLHVLYAFEAAALDWADLVEGAAQRALSVGSRLVVVDTFNRFSKLGAEAENDAGAVAGVLAPVQNAAAEHGVTFVIVHHDRKGGGDVFEAGRGSSAFQGAVDVILNIRPADRQAATVRHIRGTGRYADLVDELFVDKQPDGYVPLGDRPKMMGQTARDLVFSVLPTTEAEALDMKALISLVKEAAEAIPTKAPARGTIQTTLEKAESQKQVVKVGEGLKGDAYRYHRAGGLPDDVAALPQKLSANPDTLGWQKEKAPSPPAFTFDGPGTFDPLARPMPSGVPADVVPADDKTTPEGDGYASRYADDYPDDSEAVELVLTGTLPRPPVDEHDEEALRLHRRAWGITTAAERAAAERLDAARALHERNTPTPPDRGTDR